jgi:hypothetical protein
VRVPTVVVSLALGAALPAEAQYLRDAIAAKELICEFGDASRRDLVAATLRTRRPGSIMLIFERVTPTSAEAISTQRPGRQAITVRASDKAVHFIEPVGRSVRVTTLTACERWAARRGRESCVRFSAQHAWHFDTLAHLRPQGSFSQQPSGALAGACEPWHLE